MARSKHGLFGPLVGKLGATIHYIRKGVSVVRMISHTSHKPRSVKQKSITTAFTLVIKFVSQINDFTNSGFGIAASKTNKTAQNLFVSHTLKYAVKGEHPNKVIDFPKLLVAQGKLLEPENPVVSHHIEGEFAVVTFEWDVDPNWSFARKRDQVMMLAYRPDNEAGVYSLSGARRSIGEDVLSVKINTVNGNHHQKDTALETYLAFISDDRKSVSNSIYTGRIEL